MAKKSKARSIATRTAAPALFAATLEPNYFKQRYASVRLPVAEGPGAGFRGAQLAAIHELAGHFLSRHDPALVVMPTGSGKTAVLMMAPFYLRANRVLVVTPARLVRSQVFDQFNTLSILRKLGAVEPTTPNPTVKEQTERISKAQQWRALQQFNVVVSTPQAMSPSIKGVAAPPADLFDLVLVDEAHHHLAPTWNALIAAFPKARVALFTATPFRSDKQRLQGTLVYSYSMKQAYEDGVFGKIQYDPVVVPGGASGNRARDVEDTAIAKAVEATLKKDRANGLDHRLIVRIDSLSRARNLAKLYMRETKLRLDLVHSQLTYATSKRAVQRLRSGDIDGVICVNMLGEGFDLPQLKVAAIHSPHKSLAITLQFIGRLARPGDNTLGTATFRAVPSEVAIEKLALYKEDLIWQDLIIQLHGEAVLAETEARRVVQSFDPPSVFDQNVNTLSLHSLFPRFHAKVYSVPDGADTRVPVHMPRPFQLVFRQDSPSERVAILVVADQKRVAWCASRDLSRLEYDLIVVYHDDSSGLLFVNASRTNDSLYEAVGASMTKGAFRILPLFKLNRVLSGLSELRFPSIGMKNRVHSANTESYRTMNGSQSQNAVRPVDGLLYHRGHVTCCGSEQNRPVTIGYSSSSKLWTIGGSGSLAQLVEWCKHQANKIADAKATIRQSGIDQLPVGQPLAKLPDGLLGADWDAHAYERPPVVHFGKKKATGPLIDLDLVVDRGASNASRIRIRVTHDAATCVVDFTPAGKKLFAYASNMAARLNVEIGSHSVDFVDYLNNQPLEFYFSDFSRVRGEEHFPCPVALTPFDRGRIEVVDWAGENVDIQREYGGAVAPRSIHAYLEASLNRPANAVVLYDHGSGEVADFVTIAEAPDRVDVRLYHCKKSGAPGAGNRVGDFYEVCGQVIKSFQWIQDGKQISSRMRRRIQGQSRFVRGDITLFERLVSGNIGKLRKYTIVAVQPGVTKAGLNDACAAILAAASEYCRRAGAEDLLVLGSA